MEFMSGCGSVPSVANLVPKILISSASKNVIIIIIIIITSHLVVFKLKNGNAYHKL